MAENKTKHAINNDKKRAVEDAIHQIERVHGKSAIMRLGDDTIGSGISVIHSGAISLDLALGVGGYPKGKIVEIFGPESSGKTTLALHAIANAQKTGGVAVLIDAEYAFDANYAQNIGVDVDKLK